MTGVAHALSLDSVRDHLFAAHQMPINFIQHKERRETS